eukprot:1007182_1
MLKEQQNGSSLMEEAQPLMKDMMSMLHDEIQESSSTSSVTSKLHVQCHSQSINQSVCEFGFLIMMAISLLLPAAIFTFRYDIASQLICQGFGVIWIRLVLYVQSWQRVIVRRMGNFKISYYINIKTSTGYGNTRK